MVDVCFADQMKKLWRLVLLFYDWADIALHDNAVGVLGVSTMVVVIFISGWCFFRRLYRRPISYLTWPNLSAMKQMMMDQDISRSCLDGTSQRPSEVMANDPLLESKHKIFLSHSGAQKEFVDHLCQALEDRCHYPFFDRRHESLPKGERFPELIVQAAQQCEMLIVVVSDEYFMSKWPMIELSAFVQAHKLRLESKNSTKGPKIFPLFYGLSVGDLDDEGLRRKWFQEWETLAKVDPRNRIIVSDWKYALDVLRSFNGLPYDVNSKEIVAYVKKIVSNVCKSISPDIRWDDSHVQGKLSILKVIGEKIEGIGISRRYNVKVVGIYGVGGIGKSTTCKTLCNDFSSKFGGRVCHIEFPIEFPRVPSCASNEFLQKILRELSRKSADVISNVNEGQCKDILRKSLLKQRTFLAIDNISESHQSLQLAKTMLELPYHMDSLVVVTARSPSVLELLGINGDACIEMPDLGEEDAVRLFLQHGIGGKEFFEDEEKRDIMTCVRRCYFSKGDRQDFHYHPLALQSLGLQLGYHGEHPSLWVKHLPRVRAFNSFPGGNPVFDILRSGYDLLSPGDQTLLMDVCYFLSWMGRERFLSRACIVHKQDEEEITQRLEHLKRKGLLQDVDLKSGRVTMHDLYSEFTELLVKGSFNDPTNLRKRKWVYIQNGDATALKFKPKGGCWHDLIRLTFGDSPRKDYGAIGGEPGSLDGIKWKYFSNVEVLILERVRLEHGALNLGGLVCLRILEVLIVGVIDGIEGLDELKNLAHFTWTCDDRDIPIPLVGLLPSSLKLLQILGGVALVPDALARCHSLVDLFLDHVEALSLDLSHCWSLESVVLVFIKKLKALSGFSSRSLSSLQSLEVMYCRDLVDIPGIDHLVGLKKLRLWISLEFEVPSLLALTKLQVLQLYGLERFAVCSMDSIPRQLQKLTMILRQSNERLNLDGFNNLEELDLSGSRGLTSLVELGDLPALRRLDLHECEKLLQLPDLSKSRNLEELYISGCFSLELDELGDLPALRVLDLRDCEHLVRLPDLSKSRNLEKLRLQGCFSLELDERDIEMLSELPLLEPLPLEGEQGPRIRLDLRRGKVLVHQAFNGWYPSSWECWRSRDWEERDLGSPPIRFAELGPFFHKREKSRRFRGGLITGPWGRNQERV